MSFFNIPGLNILSAKPGSGKSSLIKFELYKGAVNKKYDYAIIFTKNIDDDYDKIIDEKFIYYNFTDKDFAKILKYQQENNNNQDGPKLLLIFDDVIGSIDFNSKLMTILVTRYRHFNIGVVFSTQYIIRIPSTIRECASKSFIFYQETKNSIKACYDSYGQSFGSLTKFREYLLKNTDNYQFIVVNGKNKSLSEKYEIKKIDINSIPKDVKIEW